MPLRFPAALHTLAHSPARWPLLSELLSAFGSGMTAPLLVIYLHAVRGWDLGPAAAVGSLGAVAGLAGNPAGGVLTDRYGPRPTAICGLALAATATAGLGTAGPPWQTMTAILLLGLGLSVAIPATGTILAQADPDQRPAVFGLYNLGINLGLGAGGLASALLIDIHSPNRFTTAYLLDAATFLGALFLLFLAPNTRNPNQPPGRAAVLPRDPLLWRLCLLRLAFVLIGSGQLRITFAAYTEYFHADPRIMSLAYLANTLSVVLTQLPVLRLTRTWRRTHILATVCGIFALTWLLVLAGGHWGHGNGPLLITAAAVLSVGEALLAISLPALVNDIAPDGQRGRYNAADMLGAATGFIAGPVLTGAFLHAGAFSLLLLAMATTLALLILPCLHLQHRVPPEANAPTPRRCQLVGDSLG